MSRVNSTGKKFNLNGNKLGLKVHSTYLQEKTPSELNKKYHSKIPRLKSLYSDKDGIKSRQTNPLYQTVVLKDSNLLTMPLSMRHKYLIRKYGRIWLLKVFGKISPTKARNYRMSLMLRKTLTEWHYISWCSSVEWRLLIRADCHYKFARLQKVWKSWRGHVTYKRTRNKIAKDYEARKQLKESFCKWRALKLQLTQNEAKATGYNQLTIKRTWFSCWKCQYKLIVYHNQLMSEAASHCNTVILNKTFYQWSIRYNEVKHSGIAQHHFINKLLRRILTTWYSHAKEKSEHKQLKELADQFSDNILLRKMFINWRIWKTTHQQMTSLAVNSHQLSLLTKCYTAWREFSYHQKLQLSCSIQARIHYERLLLSQLYRILSDALSLRKQIKRMDCIAIGHHNHTVIKTAWNYWLKKCELKEECKYKPLSIRADHHYQLCVVRKCVHYWKMFMKLQEQKHLVSLRVNEHIKNKLLPRYFEGFCLNVKICLYKRQLEEQATQFRRSVLMSSTFYFWWRHCIAWLEEKSDLDLATDHYCSNLLNNIFTNWKRQTVIRLTYRSWEVQAIDHSDRQLINTFFNKWRTRLFETNLRKEKELVTIKHHCKRLMENVFKAWIKYIMDRRIVYHQLQTAADHYSAVIIGQCFTAWKVYNKRCLFVDMQLSKASAHYNTTICAQVFLCWKDHVKDVIRFKSMLLSSMYFARKCSLRKMFNHWHKKMLVVLEAKRREDKIVRAFQLSHNKMLLRNAFHKWFNQFKEQTKHNLILGKALHHRSHLLMVKNWNKWIHYVKMRRYKEQLVMDANDFNDVRCVSLFYSLWRLKTIEAQLVNARMSKALLYWSRRMHHKCLDHWKLFVVMRRAKVERYQRAMDAYRNQLLREGVSQWIHMSSKIQENRSKKAFVTYVEDFSSTFDIVKKCALHWKRKAATNSKRHRLESHDTRTSSCDSHVSLYTDRLTPAATNKSRMVSSCDSHVTTTNHWTEIIKSLQNSKMLPSISRLPPRRPDFLSPNTGPHPVPNTNSVLDSIPNKEIVPTPQNGDEISSIMELSNDDVINNDSDIHALVTMDSCIIKPNEWKLLPPSVFITQKK